MIGTYARWRGILVRIVKEDFGTVTIKYVRRKIFKKTLLAKLKPIPWQAVRKRELLRHYPIV